MQQLTPAHEAKPAPLPKNDVECPVCGEPIRGISAARPGEHRFVGCGHYASARFLRSHTDSIAGAPRLRLGP